MTETQKALVTNYETLTAAQTRYAELKAAADQAIADQVAADAVKEKINAIGEVEYTDACKAKIDEASDAYDALTETQKALVTNYETLTAAQTRYAELKAAADQAIADQAAADAVKEKINAIGKVEYTAESKAKIDDARTAYDALTQAQQTLVENYATLTAAEDTYAALMPETGDPDEPEHPDSPGEPAPSDSSASSDNGERCDWCGEEHTDFWGKIVGFFHMIWYFWAHLFGLK